MVIHWETIVTKVHSQTLMAMKSGCKIDTHKCYITLEWPLVLHFKHRLCCRSPEAQAWNLAMFGNNRFFAFCISSRGIDEILPWWELASGLAFSESKMAVSESTIWW